MSRLKGMDWRALGLAVQIGLRRLGLMPALALGIFSVGAASALLLASRPQSSPSELRETLRQRQTQWRAANSAEPVASAPSGAGQFYEMLGEGSQAERYLKLLFKTARAHEINLDTGEYKWQSVRAIDMDRYQIRLPLKGSYAQLRAFCEQVLIELPFASLDELSLKREAIGDESLSASVQFTLHLHGGSADLASPILNANARAAR